MARQFTQPAVQAVVIVAMVSGHERNRYADDAAGGGVLNSGL
jgi:hypothetical protein